MKKQTISKIAVLFSAGLFGSMTAIYSLYELNISAGVIIPMLISSVCLTGVSMQMLETELKKIIK